MEGPPKGFQVYGRVCAGVYPTPRAESPHLRHRPVCGQHDPEQGLDHETLCAHPDHPGKPALRGSSSQP